MVFCVYWELNKPNELAFSAGVLEKKLQLCCTHYKFDEVVSIESERAKMTKTATLIEIRDVIQNNSNLIRDNIVKHLMQMIEQNLFRPLPRPTQFNYNPEEDEPYLDPEYEHIGKSKPLGVI